MKSNLGYNGLLVACSLAGMGEKETGLVLEGVGFEMDPGDLKRSRRRASVWTQALFERAITPEEFEEEMRLEMSAKYG